LVINGRSTPIYEDDRIEIYQGKQPAAYADYQIHHVRGRTGNAAGLDHKQQKLA